MAVVDGQSSGATNHVTNALRNINIHSKYQGNEKLVITNGQQLLISHPSFFFFTHLRSTQAHYLE